MFTVVGLGNPGSKYAGTRHNVGYMVIDELVSRIGVRLSAHKQTNTQAASARLMVASADAGATTAGASSAEAGAAGTAGAGAATSEQVIFAVTNSFMNTSGGPVSALLKYFHGDGEHLIVIHDDLDLPFGSLRLKRGGGEGGHNGLKSISQSLGSKNYIRMRIGIGRPPGRQDPADFVLGHFNAEQRKELPLMIADAADAVIDVLEKGLETATMRLHTAQKAAGK